MAIKESFAPTITYIRAVYTNGIIISKLQLITIYIIYSL